MQNFLFFKFLSNVKDLEDKKYYLMEKEEIDKNKLLIKCDFKNFSFEFNEPNC